LSPHCFCLRRFQMADKRWPVGKSRWPVSSYRSSACARFLLNPHPSSGNICLPLTISRPNDLKKYIFRFVFRLLLSLARVRVKNLERQSGVPTSLQVFQANVQCVLKDGCVLSLWQSLTVCGVMQMTKSQFIVARHHKGFIQKTIFSSEDHPEKDD